MVVKEGRAPHWHGGFGTGQSAGSSKTASPCCVSLIGYSEVMYCCFIVQERIKLLSPEAREKAERKLERQEMKKRSKIKMMKM